MIDTWIMTYDKLFYQERISDNMITYVNLDEGGESDVSTFKLPADVVLKDH